MAGNNEIHHVNSKFNELIDLSTAVRFDERLREVPRDPKLFKQAIASAQQRLAMARTERDETVMLRLLGYLGDASRVYGAVEQAIAYLEEALAISRRMGNRRAELANRIRLAEARKYNSEYPVAERLLREAVRCAQSSHLPELQPYLHYALQHLGKCLMEQKKKEEEAILCLEQALRLRQALGSKRQIVSTEQALAWVRRKTAKSKSDRSGYKDMVLVACPLFSDFEKRGK